MRARAFAAWSVAALSIGLATANPVYRAIVVLCGLNVLIALRRPDARMRQLLLALVTAGVIAEILTVALSHTGARTLLQIPPAVPVLGGPITLEALVFGGVSALGIAAAVLSAAPLSLVLQGHELVDALPRALTRSGAVVGTALNLIPGLARSTTEIRDAQRMRGWRAGRVHEWPDIAVPVVLTALEHSMQLAEAMEARGYGAGTRTHYTVLRWDAASAIVTVVSLLAAAGFIALRITGGVGDWYPFPALTPPTVSPAALCCCAALLAPLFAWRR